MKKWIKQNELNILIMIIYSICSLIILSFHESWRDEAQSWLIARDLDFFGIIQQMKYEGHFLVWYLIIAPFAKLGLPYCTIKVISWIITSISVWLILLKSPFKWQTKLLIIFSYPMIYLYPAISRCYCLIPLAITFIAIAYKNRENKPIQYVLSIALLANTHVIMLGLVGMLLLTFYIEQFRKRKSNTKIQNRNNIISFVIISLILIISAIPIMSSLTTNKEISIEYSFSFAKMLNILSQSIYTVMASLSTYSIIIVVCVLILIYVCIIYELRKNPLNFTIILFSVLYQLVIYEYIYFASAQRANSVFLIILLFAWIQLDEKDIKKDDLEQKIIHKILISLLVLSLLFGIINVYNEIMYRYSSAKQTAEFVEKYIQEDSVVISNNMPYSSAVIPYLKKHKIWNPQRKDYFTYVTWDKENEESYYADFFEIIKENFRENKEIYYIYARKGKNEGTEETELENIRRLEKDGYLIKIFESDESIIEEDYDIYKIEF